MYHDFSRQKLLFLAQKLTQVKGIFQVRNEIVEASGQLNNPPHPAAAVGFPVQRQKKVKAEYRV